MNKNKNAKKRVSLIIALIVVIAGGYAYWQFNAAKTASPENKGTQATNTQSRGTSGYSFFFTQIRVFDTLQKQCNHRILSQINEGMNY